jgi:hypothetical protein
MRRTRSGGQPKGRASRSILASRYAGLRERGFALIWPSRVGGQRTRKWKEGGAGLGSALWMARVLGTAPEPSGAAGEGVGLAPVTLFA